MEIVSQHQIVTDRELKVRLKREIFPWVDGRVLNDLVEDGTVRLVRSPGRKGRMGTPELLFMDPVVRYDGILELLLDKRRNSSYIKSQLTRLSPAGIHAEDVFERAFNSLRFEILGRDVSEYRGRKTEEVTGKEPPNLEVVSERNRVTYGVDIKNWIKFERNSIVEVMEKVDLAVQLDVVPFICASNVILQKSRTSTSW